MAVTTLLPALRAQTLWNKTLEIVSDISGLDDWILMRVSVLLETFSRSVIEIS
jgi:hypothetical protein